jgi:predicted Zn-dependent peptidase
VQKYTISELDSGERVITERVPSVRSVAIGYWIGAGSRDEKDERAGVSHFLEHLLFKGSASYTATEIAEIFDGLGGELNAATSREHTVVYARVPDAHLETAIAVMTDMVFAPTFADLDAEREVVLEEIAMYEDTPQELVHDLFSEAVFGSHPLGRPPKGQRVRRPLVAAPPPGLRFQRKETEQYHVCIGAPGIGRSDRRRFAASLLDSVLGGSASSRLFQEIREKRGMAYAVYTFASQYTDTGLVGFYVGTREDNLNACLEIAVHELAEIAAGELRPNELERAKENLKGRIVLSMESTANRMSRLGKSLVTDTELQSLDRVIAEIDAVEPEELSELARVLLARERLSAAGIGPDEDRFADAVALVNPALTLAAA